MSDAAFNAAWRRHAPDIGATEEEARLFWNAGLADRDSEWVLAMARALGADSGLTIPIVPDADAFRKLVTAIREEEWHG